MKRLNAVITCLPLLLLLTACSEETKPATAVNKEPEKPAVPVSAQYAFHQMYVTARSWAPDAQPLRMASIDLNEAKSEDGKAGAWECTFVTERMHRARRYTYSVVALSASNLRKGVFGDSEDSWTASGQTRPFPVQAFKTDATEAYEVAMKKGADYAKKHPDMPVKFLLESTARLRTSNPAWRVIWGESVAMSNYSIFVDASTGEYLQTAR